ncbi:MAG: transcriptional regulator GcvA, partial [Casimicrobiaceae bacterium]
DIDLDVRANNAYVDFNRDDADVAIRYGLGSWPGVIAEHVLDECIFRFAARVSRKGICRRAP